MIAEDGAAFRYTLLLLFYREHLVVKEVNRLFQDMLHNYTFLSLRGTFYVAVVVTVHEFMCYINIHQIGRL